MGGINMSTITNNKSEYRRRLLICTFILDILAFGGCVALRAAFNDVSDIWAITLFGIIFVIVFTITMLITIHSDTNKPEMEADGKDKSDIARDTSLKFALVGAISYFALTLIGSLISAGSIPFTDILALMLGCTLFGFIFYGVALLVTYIFAPKELIPWDTIAGKERYEARSKARFARIASYTPPATSMIKDMNSLGSGSVADTSSNSGYITGDVYSSISTTGALAYYDNKNVYKVNVYSRSELGRYDREYIYNTSGLSGSIVAKVKSNYSGTELDVYRFSDNEYIGHLASGKIYKVFPEQGNLISTYRKEQIGAYSDSNIYGAAAAACLCFFSI